MSTDSENPLDDLFLGCALTAFLQVASEQRAIQIKRRPVSRRTACTRRLCGKNVAHLR